MDQDCGASFVLCEDESCAEGIVVREDRGGCEAELGLLSTQELQFGRREVGEFGRWRKDADGFVRGRDCGVEGYGVRAGG